MRFLIALQVVLLSRQFISLQANNASQSVTNVTGLLAVGGLGVVDVEYWSPTPIECNLPDLPKPMSDHNVDLVQDQVVSCFLDQCYILTKAGWQLGPKTLK